MNVETNVKGNYTEFVTLTLKSKGVKVDSQKVEETLANLYDTRVDVAANALIGDLGIQDTENKEIAKALQTVLDGIDKKDGTTDDGISKEQLTSDDEVDLGTIVSKDENEDLYDAIIQAALETEETTAQESETIEDDSSNSKSVSADSVQKAKTTVTTDDTTSADTTDVSNLPTLSIDVSDSTLSLATNKSEVPDFLTYSDNSNSPNEYTSKEDDKTYKKISPKYLKDYEKYNLVYDGNKILSPKGKLLGYLYQNSDGSTSYYMQSDINKNNFSVYASSAPDSVEDSDIAKATDNSEFPDDFSYDGTGKNGENLYTTSDDKQYKKVSPSAFKATFGEDLTIDGDKILTPKGNVIGYTYENSDGSVSYYLLSDVNSSNIKEQIGLLDNTDTEEE